MCLPSRVKICISLAVVILGLFITPLIVELALTDPDEKFWSLLAIVKVEPPAAANNPSVRNVCVFPFTSLLLFNILATSSIDSAPVMSTVTDEASANVTVKLVKFSISDDDIPNLISGWVEYELKFINSVPFWIIAAPPSFENSVDVTGFNPLENTLFTLPIKVWSSKFIFVISSNCASLVLLELELTRVVEAAAKSWGLVSKKLIPEEALSSTIENSSPSRGFPKKEILNPSVSIVSLPLAIFFKLSEDKFQTSNSSLYITVNSSSLICEGFVTKTATPTLDLLVGFSTAFKLETENIWVPFSPFKFKPDWFTSLNLSDTKVARASISCRVSSLIANASTIPAIIPPWIWFVAVWPLPTTGWSLEPWLTISITVVPDVPLDGLSFELTITGPEPVLPSLTSACPFPPYETVICVTSESWSSNKSRWSNKALDPPASIPEARILPFIFEICWVSKLTDVTAFLAFFSISFFRFSILSE